MKQQLTQEKLEQILMESRPETQKGATASYIPILKNADPKQLGVCVIDRSGRLLKAGDAECLFTLQSIVKVLIFTCSLLHSGKEKVSEKVSVKPTNEEFNSIIHLETKNNHKPLNPMINAGAIVCLGFVKGKTMAEKSEHILDFVRKLAGNDCIDFDEEVYRSEQESGSRNRALAYYMKSTGIIGEEVEVEDLLNAYFRVCSIRVNCEDIAKIALVYGNNGVDPRRNQRFFSKEIAQLLKATMVMCGMYDESGDVAVRIGLPTKSGVAGGLMSLIPNQMGIGIYGPALDKSGSSIAGLALLERLSKYLDASIF